MGYGCARGVRNGLWPSGVPFQVSRRWGWPACGCRLEKANRGSMQSRRATSHKGGQADCPPDPKPAVRSAPPCRFDCVTSIPWSYMDMHFYLVRRMRNLVHSCTRALLAIWCAACTFVMRLGCKPTSRGSHPRRSCTRSHAIARAGAGLHPRPGRWQHQQRRPGHPGCQGPSHPACRPHPQARQVRHVSLPPTAAPSSYVRCCPIHRSCI